jgi:hypothetical protein
MRTWGRKPLSEEETKKMKGSLKEEQDQWWLTVEKPLLPYGTALLCF